MREILGIFSRIPFLLITTSIIIGIIVGLLVIDIFYCLIPVGLAFIIFFILKNYCRDVDASLKLRHYHWSWVFFIFMAIGMMSSSLNYPVKHDLNSSEFQKYSFACATVKNKVTKTSGDRLIVSVNKITDRLGNYKKIKETNIEIQTNSTTATIGDNIIFPINFKEIIDSKNYDGSDYSKYMFYKGIRYKQYCHTSDFTIYSENRNLRSTSTSIRDEIAIIIENSSLSKETQNFLITILLGDNSYIDEEVRENFANAGIAHILALSGLHVGIIIIILNVLLSPLNFFYSKKPKYVLLIITIWIFAFITGLSPSVVRASVMATFYLLSLILERQNNAFNSIFAAASLILIYSPFSLFDVGFQLSFVATLSLIAFSNKVNPINRHSHPQLYKLLALFLTSIIAVVGSWTITAYYFHTLPILFLPLNVIVIPFLPLYIGVAIIYIFINFIGFDSALLTYFLDYFYNLMSDTSSSIGSLSYATLDIWISSTTVILYLLLLLLITYWSYTDNKKIFKLIFISLGLVLLSVIITPNGKPIDGFIIQDRWDNTSVRTYNDGKDSLTIFQPDTTTILKIYNRIIISVDNNFVSKVAKKEEYLEEQGKLYNYPKVKCDYLLISKGYRGNLNTLLKFYAPKMIVLMPSLHIKKEKSLIKEATESNYSIYSIRNNGAMRYYVDTPK